MQSVALVRNSLRSLRKRRQLQLSICVDQFGNLPKWRGSHSLIIFFGVILIVALILRVEIVTTGERLFPLYRRTEHPRHPLHRPPLLQRRPRPSNRRSSTMRRCGHYFLVGMSMLPQHLRRHNVMSMASMCSLIRRQPAPHLLSLLAPLATAVVLLLLHSICYLQ